MKGKDKCRILKDIRREIAKNNNIEYVTSECKFNGECKGTCPKCEAELRYLEQELEKRRALGKKAVVAGITAASLVSLSSMTACNIPFAEKVNTGYEELDGDIAVLTEGDTASEDIEGLYPADDTERSTETENEIIDGTPEYSQELLGDIDVNHINIAAMDRIISEFESKGYTVECTNVNKEILNGERYRLVFDNDIDTQIVVYLYDSSEEAKADSECIDKSGFFFIFNEGDESTRIDADWVNTPHFYLYENTIVQYVGDDEDIMSVIETICGTYFAGGK